MDFTKEYKLKELIEPVLTQCRRRLRRTQPLLVLSLTAAGVSYWQQGKMRWQEQLTQDMDDGQCLQDALREVLLAREVEEGIATVLIPKADSLHSELLTLPRLPAREMQQAAAWEVQHCVPWEAGSYSYGYSVSNIATGDEQQCQVQLAALPDALRQTWEQLCQKLLLRLEYVALDTQLSAEELVQAWYAGKGWPQGYRQQKQKQLPLRIAGLRRYLPRLACAVLALAFCAYGAAWGGRYLAQRQLQGVTKQLAGYAPWQERQRESKMVAKQIQQLQGLLQAAKAPALQVSSELEALSRQMLPGTWLTVLEYGGAAKPLLLQGQAVDSAVVQALAEGLQQSGRYSRVELLETQQQGGLAAYRLQLLPQEGKSDAKKAQ